MTAHDCPLLSSRRILLLLCVPGLTVCACTDADRVVLQPQQKRGQFVIYDGAPFSILGRADQE